MYMGALRQVNMETQPAAMKKLGHTYAMCNRPFLLLSSKVLGTRLVFTIQTLATHTNTLHNVQYKEQAEMTSIPFSSLTSKNALRQSRMSVGGPIT